MNNKMIFSFLFVTTVVLMQASVECVMFDWMMPNFLSSNQDNFADSVLGKGFQDSILSLQNSMSNLKSNMESMSTEFKQIRDRTYTIADLASVIFSNDSSNNSYVNTGGCSCVNLTCMCCAHLEIDQLNLNDTGADLVYFLVDFYSKFIFNF